MFTVMCERMRVFPCDMSLFNDYRDAMMAYPDDLSQSPAASVRDLLGAFMAESKEVSVKDVSERMWIKKALENLRTSLVRSRDKEIAGSEIWHLRGRELESLNLLIGRFS